ALKLACNAASEVASTNPRPYKGVGMRKMTLAVLTAVTKSGCDRLQPAASERPVTVYRSCTPPSFTPLVVRKRASRTGPSVVMNFFLMLRRPPRVARATCGLAIGFCGLFRPGLLPPAAG